MGSYLTRYVADALIEDRLREAERFRRSQAVFRGGLRGRLPGFAKKGGRRTG
jgi:hypothetical protein